MIIEKWMGALYPVTLELQQKIQDGVIDDPDDHADDVYMDLSYRSLDFGYVIGYLMGLRQAGIRGDDLLRYAEGFLLEKFAHEEWKAQVTS